MDPSTIPKMYTFLKTVVEQETTGQQATMPASEFSMKSLI